MMDSATFSATLSNSSETFSTTTENKTINNMYILVAYFLYTYYKKSILVV